MEDTNPAAAASVTNPSDYRETTTIPVVREHLTIGVRQRVTGQVEVSKVVHTEQLDVPLETLLTTYRETRLPINRVVDTMPQIRYEGHDLIVPVVREEEVVVRRLVLVEEIHLRREQHREQRTDRIELRSEEATVRRRAPDPPAQ